MPVLMVGAMPVSTTFRTSIPWGPGVVERRQGPVRVAPDGDLVHGVRVCQRVGRCSSADEAGHSRGGGHGEAAQPDRLDDRRIADVGVGVGLAEAGKVEASRHLHWSREPGIASAADANSEVGAVAAHGGNNGGSRDAARRVHDRLAHDHGEVEEELVVAADEGEDLGQLFAVVDHACQGRRDLPQEEAGAADIALVHLVAHREAAGDDPLEGEAAALPERRRQRGPEDLRHPAQAGQHLAVVTAEAHHLAEALVEGRVGAVTEGSILDHHHRHGTGD